MEKIRIQKIFTDNGIMSRRAAEREIAAGNVRINGEIASLGDRADPEHDVITLSGKKVKCSVDRERTYIVLNKPLGYVTTAKDEKGRENVIDLVGDVGVRVYPIGRLDMFSEGLLILTDDGELTNKMTHPSGELKKVYTVKIKGYVTDEALAALRAPMTIDSYKLRPVEVRLISRGKIDRSGCEYSALEFTLHEGRNRQIRKMCEKCSLTVMSLCRIRIGEIELGNLPSGEWRYLSEGELEYLKSI
ncbi:MAG: rRNA pseudouridine synthase [Clostridia bacterium]|nr:rRNA pseudouridine synthase [Clostridia bacterium]